MIKYKVGEKVHVSYGYEPPYDKYWLDVDIKITIIVENYNKKGQDRYYGIDGRGIIHSAYEKQVKGLVEG